VGKGRRGDYVCAACLEKAQDDPHALLLRFIREAGLGRGEELPQVAGYDIERRLGIGGFGAVYLARDKKSREQVALYVMNADGSGLVVYCGCRQVKIESPRQRISGDDEGIRLWGAKMSSVSGGLTQ
jgi:hypothetical protein